MDARTLGAVHKPAGEEAVIVAPSAVFSRMTAALRAITRVLTHGASTTVLGIEVAAVPAYNANHPRGAGNGYVVGIAGKRLYVSGDTGDTPEMRGLRDIDAAFVCMNVPFTMTASQAAAAVRAFAPKVVYP